MTKSTPGVDKNLQNVIHELETPDLLAHENQQINQEHMDEIKGQSQHAHKRAYENENHE